MRRLFRVQFHDDSRLLRLAYRDFVRQRKCWRNVIPGVELFWYSIRACYPREERDLWSLRDLHCKMRRGSSSVPRNVYYIRRGVGDSLSFSFSLSFSLSLSLSSITRFNRTYLLSREKMEANLRLEIVWSEFEKKKILG